MPNLKDENSEVDAQTSAAEESLDIAVDVGSAKVTTKKTSGKSKNGDVTVTTATKPPPRRAPLRLFTTIVPYWQDDK